MKFISILFSAAFAICGCSMVNGLSGTMEAVELDAFAGYTSIEVSNCIHVSWNPDAELAAITADKDVLPYVAMEVSGNSLRIYLKDSRRFRRGAGRIDVCLPSVPGLRSVKLCGASSFSSDSTLTAETFKVDVSGASAFAADIVASEKIRVSLSGASKATAAIDAPVLDISVSGASAAQVSGVARVFSADVSGASTVSSGKDRVMADDVKCSVSGASRLYVNCSSSIEGSASGASSVHYGNAGATSSLSASGASSVSAD